MELSREEALEVLSYMSCARCEGMDERQKSIKLAEKIEAAFPGILEQNNYPWMLKEEVY